MRIDAYLVGAGLARARGHAKELIDAGLVTCDGVTVRRAAAPVPPEARVEVAEHERWVGRAAHKLLAAVDAFGPAFRNAIEGARCLDVGASTGGFTQVLLEHGAAHVTAVDVGHGQLVRELADDPRVTDRPGVNVRDVRPGELGEPFDVVVGDLSFISLRLVLDVIAEQLDPAGQAVLLVKPQFEVGRERLGKGGLVRSARDRQRALADVLAAGIEAGLEPLRAVVSPLPGATGNVEYLVWWRPIRRASDKPRQDTGQPDRMNDSEKGTRAGADRAEAADAVIADSTPDHSAHHTEALVTRLLRELDEGHR